MYRIDQRKIGPPSHEDFSFRGIGFCPTGIGFCPTIHDYNIITNIKRRLPPLLIKIRSSSASSRTTWIKRTPNSIPNMGAVHQRKFWRIDTPLRRTSHPVVALAKTGPVILRPELLRVCSYRRVGFCLMYTSLVPLSCEIALHIMHDFLFNYSSSILSCKVSKSFSLNCMF